ncbi:MAG: alpha/beta hydrolase [Chloroflexi bacterium]|jgi:dienelactone hydrolase|nr:alpha/beta hydrolase [Chloroflexota bacterium]
MVTALFLTAIVLELALMAYSLATRSSQEKTRSIIRVVALVLFTLLVATSLIQWSFRWVALAALLLVWALLALLKLFGRQRPARAYRARAIVFRAIAALVLLFLALSPALLFPPHPQPAATGPYAVASAQYTYTDESRAELYDSTGEMRKVNVAFWYPENAEGPFPLVVFSHGALGIRTSNLSLYHELASHGYVVASPDHPYLSFWSTDTDGQTTFLSMDYFRELQQEDAQRDKEQSYAYYQKWMSVRMGDLHVVLDTILGEASGGAPGVYSLVDPERIGVMGHSLGGSAALGMGRERGDVSAVIALESPFMFDIQGVDHGEFVLTREPYPVPVLNVYSDSAWGHLSEWPQYAGNVALLSGDHPAAFNLHIDGLGHLGLTDLALSSPLLVRLADGARPARDSVEGLRLINETCLRFFDAYLKNHGKFQLPVAP